MVEVLSSSSSTFHSLILLKYLPESRVLEPVSLTSPITGITRVLLHLYDLSQHYLINNFVIASTLMGNPHHSKCQVGGWEGLMSAYILEITNYSPQVLIQLLDISIPLRLYLRPENNWVVAGYKNNAIPHTMMVEIQHTLPSHHLLSLTYSPQHILINPFSSATQHKRLHKTTLGSSAITHYGLTWPTSSPLPLLILERSRSLEQKTKSGRVKLTYGDRNSFYLLYTILTILTLTTW